LINERIRFPEVRVIDSDGKQLGVLSTDKALQVAKEKELDLVLIAPTVKPPVCKIADYGKLRYEMIKKEKETRRSQKAAGVLKELKLSVKIGEHDFQVVTRKSVDFLIKKNKVKVTLKFKGREIVHPELGLRVLQRLIEAVKETGIPEYPPKKEGRHYILMLVPK